MYRAEAIAPVFEIHADALYAWVGLATVSVVVFGVAATLPASPPPDAAGVAHTIDSVATAEYVATAEHGLAADRIRLTPQRVALASDGGTASTTLRGAPVTPVLSGPAGAAGAAGPARSPGPARDTRLAQVLSGVPPERVFERPAEFAAATARARSREHTWRRAPPRLTIRQVVYGGHRVTLVG